MKNDNTIAVIEQLRDAVEYLTFRVSSEQDEGTKAQLQQELNEARDQLSRLKTLNG